MQVLAQRIQKARQKLRAQDGQILAQRIFQRQQPALVEGLAADGAQLVGAGHRKQLHFVKAQRHAQVAGRSALRARSLVGGGVASPLSPGLALGCCMLSRGMRSLMSL